MMARSIACMLAAALVRVSLAAGMNNVSWSVLPKFDCGGWDVTPCPACGKHPPGAQPAVAHLKACCMQTPGCGGFNTHGVIKRQGCETRKAPEPSVDLYILHGPPTPPPPPPLPPPPPGPACAALPPGRLPTPEQLPLYHVLPGAEPHGTALCESRSTNAIVLQAQCAATKGCVAFTVGSGGGEPGDLPPHDCRGSRLYSADALATNASEMAKPGVDLFVLGPEIGSAVSTVTPKPRQHIFAQGVIKIDRTNFKIATAVGSASNGVLRDALKRFSMHSAFASAEERSDRSASMTNRTCGSLEVMVQNASSSLIAGVNESYTLEIKSGTSMLRSETVWGALFGLETFAQTIMHGNSGPDVHFVDEQTIHDSPHYSYRGLMLDTARHFLPLDMLYTVIDGMAVEKLNVLHWHAVDDQSFPLEVQSLPRLASAAQFGSDHTYSVENITALVAYAKSRGIRVMLEIDTPGHCQVLEHSYPELGLIAECPGTTCWPPLDVSKNSTMMFIQTIFKDLLPLFPNQDVFIGGDECHTTCWADNPEIAAWAKSMNLTCTAAVESVGGEGSVFGWYIDRIVEIVHEQLGKRPNMWSPLSWDPLSPPRKLVSSKAILNLWTGNLKELAWNITRSGTNDVVTSAGWYLPAGGSYTVDPASFCETDPSKPFYCTPEQRSRIIGGEACMWGEGTDLSNFFTNVWPQLSEVSEKLWSGPVPRGGLDLLDGRQRRLRQHRCRLISQGVPVANIGSMIYVPDASHASFATWRKNSWCPGDQNWRHTGTSEEHAGLEQVAARGYEWAQEARDAALARRAQVFETPFDAI